MVEFCPECSNLLRKRVTDGNKALVCRCGFQKELKRTAEEINKEEVKKEAVEKEVVQKETVENKVIEKEEVKKEVVV